MTLQHLTSEIADEQLPAVAVSLNCFKLQTPGERCERSSLHDDGNSLQPASFGTTRSEVVCANMLCLA